MVVLDRAVGVLHSIAVAAFPPPGPLASQSCDNGVDRGADHQAGLGEHRASRLDATALRQTRVGGDGGPSGGLGKKVLMEDRIMRIHRMPRCRYSNRHEAPLRESAGSDKFV